ncbi:MULTISPECIES: YetF domain-containing protein [unclassified Clostridium]|uniref:YetF domain-containing protein n=1 Tax=unclassified Clostridium TaxID=2614128 RepID=UPI002079D788|nr:MULTISPECIES: YetF domain-containing protein [unclassified Clostridium]
MGLYIDKNLKSAGLNKEWLKSELNKQNIKESSEVFYAGVDNTKKLYILKKSIKK